MKIKQLSFVVCLIIICLASCKAPTNISYFQDAQEKGSVNVLANQQFRLRPEDKIRIVVNSRDEALEKLFNLRSVQTGGGGGNHIVVYTLDNEGYIDFPVLGKIKASGKTRQELATIIKNRLVSEEYVTDAIVTVEYYNMCISVLGEVSHPGKIEITRDHYTILDAIADAGDLTINGLRENVTILRQEGDAQKTYTVNLCSEENVLNSPAYYLQQNDIIYVVPSDKKKRESQVLGNSVMTPAFWISLASFAMTITAFVLK